MKLPLTSGYSFAASQRRLDFSLAAFDLRRLYAVINLDAGKIIYAVGSDGLGYTTQTGSSLTLAYDTTAMADADDLMVIYDDGSAPLPGGAATSALQDVIAAALGAPADDGATSDGGTFSLVALAKRGLANWTTLLKRIPGTVAQDASLATGNTALASLVAATGASTDAATGSGTATTAIGALRAIRDRLLSTVQVQLAQMLPSGTNVIGKVGLDSASTLPAGTNLLGKVAIDASGNGVALSDTRSTGTFALGTVGNALTIPVPPGARTMSFNVRGTNASGALYDIYGTTDDTDLTLLSDVNVQGRLGTTLRNRNLPDLSSSSYINVAAFRTIRFVVTTAGSGTGEVRYTFSNAGAPTNGVNTSAHRGGLDSVSRIVSAVAGANATLAKAFPGRLYKVTGWNAANSVRWLRFYDTAAVPVPGTTPPKFAVPLPPGAFNISAESIGHVFTAGIGFALTTGAADNDTGALTAGDIQNLNVWYA